MKKIYIILALVVFTLTNGFAKKKTLIIANGGDYKPYAFVDENNKIVGFDIDIINTIAKESGYDIKLETIGFQAMIPGVSTGKYDAAIYSITATDERKKIVDFTDSYSPKIEYTIILINKDDKNIQSIKDLKNKKIAANAGTVQYDWAIKNLKDIELIPFDTYDVQFLALKQKKVDAILISEIVAKSYLEKEKSAKILEGEKIPLPGVAIVIKKGNKQLLDDFNKALEKIKNDGRFNEFVKKWFKY